MDQPLALNLTIADTRLSQSQYFSVRYAVEDDLPYISAIEKQTSAYPWSDKQIAACINQSILLVKNDEILGFAVVVLSANQAELHNITISPDVQSQGLGGLFLQALIESIPIAVETFYLEVRASNYRALRLYHGLEFIKIAERKDYYRNGLAREDAIIMARKTP